MDTDGSTQEADSGLDYFAHYVNIFYNYGRKVLGSLHGVGEKTRYRVLISEWRRALDNLEEISDAIWNPLGSEDELHRATTRFVEDYDVHIVNPNMNPSLSSGVDYKERYWNAIDIILDFLEDEQDIPELSREISYATTFLTRLREQIG